MELEERVGDLEVRCYYQLSDDGINWGAIDQIGLTATSGVAYGTTFASIYQGSPYVRFGVEAKNTTSSDLNLGYATLRLEFKSC